MQVPGFPTMDTVERSEAGVVCPIVDLTSGLPLTNKGGVPVTITMRGPDSKAFRDAARALERERLEWAREHENLDTFDDDAAVSRFLASLTVAWTGMTLDDGTDVPCTPEAAAALYRYYPAFRDQVDRFTARRANFTKASSQS